MTHHVPAPPTIRRFTTPEATPAPSSPAAPEESILDNPRRLDELVDKVVDRIERRVIDELERRGRRHRGVI
jgi:hypothetical protein